MLIHYLKTIEITILRIKMENNKQIEKKLTQEIPVVI